jgi:hypothetical protein
VGIGQECQLHCLNGEHNCKRIDIHR